MRKLTEENKELASNLRKDMKAQSHAAASKPASLSIKKRPHGSDLAGSSARGSEDRSSVAPQQPKGTKRGREIEGIDKVRFHTTNAPVSRHFHASVAQLCRSPPCCDIT